MRERGIEAAVCLLLAAMITAGCAEREREETWGKAAGGKADTHDDGSVSDATTAGAGSDADQGNTGSPGTVAFEVAIQGLRSSKGLVRVSICDNPVCYEEQAGFLFEENKPADTAGVSFVFPVPPGEYVVLMFHDENGNDEFDTNLFGWPEEGFGFSNDVKPGLSAPPYEKVVVQVGSSGLAITVNVQYM